MANFDCTLFILSYKGLEHLQFLLPTVQSLIEASPDYQIEATIIENGQDLDSERWVKTNYPTFKFEFARKNDFLFSFNDFVATCASPYVFILNNDLRLSIDILNQALPVLEKDSSLFAVSCTMMDWEGKELQEAVKKGKLEKGWLYLTTEAELATLPKYSLNACGGASIYRTNMFNELGGFDPLYRPAYYEDTDLSHRAWNLGWKTINIPNAVVWHRTGGSWKNEKKKNDLESMIHRNKIIGMLRNTKSKGFLINFLFRLPIRLLTSFFMDRNFFNGLRLSLSKIPQTLTKRRTDKLDPKSVNLFLELPGKPYLIPPNENNTRF